MGKKYGAEHLAAKQEKTMRMKDPELCQVTGRKDIRTNDHHNVPRFLGGPDEAANYIRMDEEFHKCLHYICRVTRSDMVRNRMELVDKIQENILDDQRVKLLMRELNTIDDALMAEYIYNLVYNMPKEYRSNLMYESLLSCFKTIKEMKVRIMQLTEKLNYVENLIIS